MSTTSRSWSRFVRRSLLVSLALLACGLVVQEIWACCGAEEEICPDCETRRIGKRLYGDGIPLKDRGDDTGTDAGRVVAVSFPDTEEVIDRVGSPSTCGYGPQYAPVWRITVSAADVSACFYKTRHPEEEDTWEDMVGNPYTQSETCFTKMAVVVWVRLDTTSDEDYDWLIVEASGGDGATYARNIQKRAKDPPGEGEWENPDPTEPANDDADGHWYLPDGTLETTPPAPIADRRAGSTHPQ